jgi:DNA polymerase III epsilon subunit-like protein
MHLRLAGTTPANLKCIGAEPISPDVLDELREALSGSTLVGSNPSFDAGFLQRALGDAPWSHRLVNVAEGGMWVFGWDRPKGLAAVAVELRSRGYHIPEPDHTAAADVAATRAVYHALRSER